MIIDAYYMCICIYLVIYNMWMKFSISLVLIYKNYIQKFCQTHERVMIKFIWKWQNGQIFSITVSGKHSCTPHKVHHSLFAEQVANLCSVLPWSMVWINCSKINTVGIAVKTTGNSKKYHVPLIIVTVIREHHPHIPTSSNVSA